MDKYLITGLGNIGAEYNNTRHNIGFDVLDEFVKKHQGIWRIDRLAQVADLKLKGRSITCIKPTTYMNLSGKAFAYWLNKEKIEIKNTLTIVDDIALPIEKIRLKAGGSDAGHNGLKDIQFTIETTEYPKLRFGIGNNYPKGRQADFVLSTWKTIEMPIVNEKINACVTIIENFIFMGIEKTMNLCNNQVFKL